MPLDQNVAVLTVDPLMRNPYLMRVRRLIPFASGPHVSVSVPAMIPGNPHIARAWRSPPLLHDRVGRRHLNHNLISRDIERQCRSENQTNQSLAKHSPLSFFSKCHTADEPRGNQPQADEWGFTTSFLYS